MSRGGRPEKGPERQSEVINFRVTKAEADELCRGALRLGVSVSNYVRALVRRALGSS